MPKNLPPVIGMPVLTTLSEMELENSSVISALRDELSASVNRNSCCTEEQENSLSRGMRTLADKMDIFDITDQEPVFVDGFNQLLTMANSFRIDCSNCLNKNCENRDPQHPVEETRKKI